MQRDSKGVNANTVVGGGEYNRKIGIYKIMREMQLDIEAELATLRSELQIRVQGRGLL
jgi:hypothetical protein